MRIMVKIGGAQLEQPLPRASLCAAIAAASNAGHEIIVVHGGGNQIREVSKQLGIADRYHDGLRITDAATADVVLMVLAGKVNRLLTAALQRAGVAAVGISGADGDSFQATRLERPNVDLGYVGTIDATSPKLIETLIAADFVPVVATVAPGTDGQDGPFYNLNADHAAGPLCRAFRCDALLFLTDVQGVQNDNGGVLHQLTPDDCEGLVRRGTAHGGMLPKLEAAQQALRDNPRARIVIAPAAADDSVLAALLDGHGTRFVTGANDQPETEQSHG